MISRRRGREFAMQLLYAAEIGGGALEQAAAVLEREEPPVTPEARDYGLRLARAVRAHAEDIDRRIADASAHWDLGRLAVVDLILLRMSIAELLQVPDVPAKVCINKAVEIAKKFSTENSSRFVNGVLDAVAQSLSHPDAVPFSHKDNA